MVVYLNPPQRSPNASLFFCAGAGAAEDTPDPDDGGHAVGRHLLRRPYSPVRAVGSVHDVQAYFTEGALLQDASEYNTEYEDGGEGGADDGSSSRGAGDSMSMAIDEEIARLA